jgi:hypothetical protein
MVANVVQHHSEMHSMANTRDGNSALICPVANCLKHYPRHSKYMCHLKNDHNIHLTMPWSNGKQYFSSSMENLVQGAQKKTKFIVEKVGQALRRSKSFVIFSQNL